MKARQGLSSLISEQPLSSSPAGGRVSADPEIIPNFPGVCLESFKTLCAESPGDFDALTQACRSHLAAFERMSAESEEVIDDEARALCELNVRLIAAFRNGTDAERRLVWATARYFVESEDADGDFGIGGLDDDIAVANAVAGYLGHEDWKLTLR